MRRAVIKAFFQIYRIRIRTTALMKLNMSYCSRLQPASYGVNQCHLSIPTVRSVNLDAAKSMKMVYRDTIVRATFDAASPLSPNGSFQVAERPTSPLLEWDFPHITQHFSHVQTHC